MDQKIILTLIIWMTCWAGIWAQNGNPAAFTRFVLDAKVAAMGMVGTTGESGATAPLWNPARNATLDHSEVTLMSAAAFETGYASVFLSVPGWGVGYTHAGLEGILQTTRDDRNLAVETGGVYQFSGDVIYFSTGMGLTDWFKVGVMGKWISQSIATTNAQGFGVDVGVLLTPLSGTDVGVVVQNAIPAKLQWSTGTEEVMSAIIKYGVGMQVLTELKMAVDYMLEDKRPGKWLMGMEYRPIPFAAFRLGSYAGRLTVGTGLDVYNVCVDFSWEAADTTDLDAIYRFSVGMRL